MGRRPYYPGLVAISRFLVYGLADPRSGELRYVGLSTQGLKRPKEHLSPKILEREKHTHKARWILGLLANGLRPEIRILRECGSVEEVEVAERDMIAELRQAGAPLTNIADGGLGPFGVTRSEAFKQCARDRMLGTRLSPETIAKRTASRAGWKPSEETRRKLSDAHKGKPKPEGFGAKVSAAKIGKKRPPEFGEKMSKLMTGKPSANPEHIKKLGESWRGKKRSEETRAKMAAAKKAWWAAKKAAEEAEALQNQK